MTDFKSINITDIEDKPSVTLNDKKGYLNTVIDRIAVDTSAVIADDVLLMGLVPSNAVITSIKLRNAQLDSGAAISGNWGLYYSGLGGTQVLDGTVSGVVVKADAFILTDTTLQTDNLQGTDIRFAATSDFALAESEAWELGDLPEDPGGFFYIGFEQKVVAGTPVDGSIILQIQYL